MRIMDVAGFVWLNEMAHGFAGVGMGGGHLEHYLRWLNPTLGISVSDSWLQLQIPVGHGRQKLKQSGICHSRARHELSF